MRQFPTTTSPFKQRTFFKQQELEIICLDELSKFGLLPDKPEVIQIESFIIKRFGITPSYDASLPPNILALTRFGSKGPTDMLISRILGEDATDVGRRRTNATLAHETGHCLLHGYLFVISGRKGGTNLGRSIDGTTSGIDLADKTFLCRDVDMQTPGRVWWEWQADAMIGPLLMPSTLVGKLLKEKFNIELPTLRTGTFPLEKKDLTLILKDIAMTFDVNPAAARIRLKTLSFTEK